MRALILAAIASLTTLSSASPGGAHRGIVLSGPSGIVTNHGAIGPAALGLGGLGTYTDHGGAYIGGPLEHSAYVGGSAGPSAYVGGPTGPSAYVGGPVGPPAFVGAPAVSHASVVGPAAGIGGHGLGLGLPGLGLGLGGYGGYSGYTGYGGYQNNLGLASGVVVTNGGGTVGVGQHGVMVKGPATVPATIIGPAGKVVANGLYGVPTHGHGW